MTAAEQLRQLDRQRNALLDALQAMPPALLVAKPLADKWSLLEIVEHLVIAERVVFQGLPELGRLRVRQRGFKDHVRYRVAELFLRSGIALRVPSPAMLPKGGHTLGALRHLWDENHAWLQTYVNALATGSPSPAVFEHPAAGPLTVEQALHLDQIHLNGHTRQIRKLQSQLT